MTNTLTQRRLRRLIEANYSNNTVSRGAALFRDHHVQTIACTLEADNGLLEFEAEVAGSQGDDYEVVLSLSESHISNLCSCYVGINCKHGAALAYALAEDLEAYLPSHQTQQADPLEQWLGKLRSSRASQANSASMQPKHWHLFFLLHVNNKETNIELRERYLKKDGSWGQHREVAPYQVLHNHRTDPLLQQIVAILAENKPTLNRANSSLDALLWPIEGAGGQIVLTLAVESQRLLDGGSMQVISRDEPRHLNFSWHEDDDTHRLQTELEPMPDKPWQQLPVTPPMYFTGHSLGPIETSLNPAELDLLLTMPPVPSVQLPRVCANLAHLLNEHDLPAPDAAAPLSTYDSPVPKASLCSFSDKVNGVLPALRLSMVYGNIEFPIRYDQAITQEYDDDQGDVIEMEGEFAHVVRSFKEELQHANDLRKQELIPYFYGEEHGELWAPLTFNPQDYIRRWHAQKPKLEQFFSDHHWLVAIDDTYPTDKARAQISGQANNYSAGWFDLELNVEINGVSMNTSDLIARWLALDCPDTMAVQNEQQQWLLTDMTAVKPIAVLLTELYQEKSLENRLRLPNFKVTELDALDNINYKQAPELKKLQHKLRNFKGLKDVKPSKLLKAELRDYQQQGLNWLNFLHEYQFGGILADDMGLGKTLQSLAFIQKLKTGRKLKNGALIVAPTSLLWNWQTEAEKFTPNLRCLVLHGTERKPLFEELADYDLIITTYGLIPRDLEHHQHFFYDLIVLDEAQKIKNKNAKITRAVQKLPSEMRLCLTGTPLENHLGELWSIMNFAQPELLGSYDYFRQNYRKEIEDEQNAERNQELSNKIAPFMVRRTKQAVAKELPKKSEIIQTVHLEKDQKALYESIRISMEKRIRDLIKQKGAARSHIEFLDALLKLRQACIEPRLVKLEQAKKVKNSAKMAWLIQTVPELVEEGRAILIFSQFTKMLDLIESEFKSLNIATAKLTGRTRNRQAAIAAFQNGDVPVFLISLKAGGAGLNLTTADSVIHVDPWWNPAVENQATDRAYRIGQNKPVFVYKLVAAGTVEEKIQAMQKHKQALADTLFDATAKAKLPLNGDELLGLFQK
ncbi:MAG TPA: DEAD/DEAH box helicase [Marinagarivorans sp.]